MAEGALLLPQIRAYLFLNETPRTWRHLTQILSTGGRRYAPGDCVTNLMLSSYCVPPATGPSWSEHIVYSNFSYPDLGRRQKKTRGCHPSISWACTVPQRAACLALCSPTINYQRSSQASFLLLSFRGKRTFPRREGSHPLSSETLASLGYTLESGTRQEPFGAMAFYA